MSALAIVMGLAVLAHGAPPSVHVELLAKLSPSEAVISGRTGNVRLAARGDSLYVDGKPTNSWGARRERWTLSIPGGNPRTYQAAITVRAEGGVLRFHASFDLEEYVAAVVASETTPGTSPEALRAQAVVVRSYALAAHDRHPGGGLCDLAHCQLLKGTGIPPAHRGAAHVAASATAGEVLVTPKGDVAVAHFHAACGGHTADPVEAFGGQGGASASVSDPGCPLEAWQARVEGTALARAVQEALARSDSAAAAAVPGVLRASRLHVGSGAGGWVTQVSDVGGRWRLSGDAFARAADAAAGRGVVRSSRFSLWDDGTAVVFRGSGRGHGVGLCQAGAERQAAAGQGYRSILAWYFPGAGIVRIRDEGRHRGGSTNVQLGALERPAAVDADRMAARASR